MTQWRTSGDVRHALERRLKKPPDDEIWAYLEEESWVSEVVDTLDVDDANGVFDGLVDQYRRLERLRGSARRPVVHVREAEPDKRWEALARVIAAEANRFPQVRRFQRDVLGGRLLRPDEVMDWMKEQARRDRRVIWIRSVEPLDTVADFEHPLRPSKSAALAYLDAALEEMGWSDFRTETLRYTYPADGRIDGNPAEEISDVVQVTPGPLLLLKETVEDLTAAYPWWDEGETATFVLTGNPPRCSPARGSYRAPELVLHVDPRLPRKQLAAFYAQVRSRLKRPMRKGKPMSDKNLELAVFNAENAGQPWSKKMSKWNALHPSKTYSDRRLFARDAKNAYQRVRASLED